MSNYDDALLFAARVFRGAYRPMKASTHLAHSVAVANSVAYYGGNDTLKVGALLHDVLEFKGQQAAVGIEDQFGPEVARIVWACTDGLHDDNGSKPAWFLRKKAFLSALEKAEPDVQLVVLCDKLENAREVVRELERGRDLRGLFNHPKHEVLWSYQEALSILHAAKTPGHEEFFRTVHQLVVLSAPDSTEDSAR